MSDILVKPLSSEEIRIKADAAREMFGVASATAVDITWLLEGVLPEMIPQFALIPDNSALEYDKDAMTFYDPLRIECPESLYQSAQTGEPVARFKLAHELGHVLLHRNVARNWSVNDFRAGNNRTMSSEWQADEFGFYFLTPSHVASQYKTQEEIAHWLQITPEFAARAIREYKLGKREIPEHLRKLLNF